MAREIIRISVKLTDDGALEASMETPEDGSSSQHVQSLMMVAGMVGEYANRLHDHINGNVERASATIVGIIGHSHAAPDDDSHAS